MATIADPPPTGNPEEGEEESQVLPDHYNIRGIPIKPGQTSIPFRLECDDWSRDHENSIQVSLFIRAMQKFYAMPYDDKLSYFQVAGIHGYPGNLVWDGAPPPTFRRKKDLPGVYCTHNLPTFPTWHRPYILLFEQLVFEHMLEVVEQDLKFETEAEKDEWFEEAVKWRLPYFDWALPTRDTGLPHIFTLQSINIRVPKDAKGEVQPPQLVMENPLDRFSLVVNGKKTPMGSTSLPEKYRVNDVMSEDNDGNPLYLPWSKCSGTSRWGIENDVAETDWSQGINRYERSNEAIKTHQWTNKDEFINKKSIGEMVYRLFTPNYVTSWKQFSTTQYSPDIDKAVNWQEALSLEFVHNNLHGFIGGDNMKTGVGHMQNVPVAAFDPIFWLHHCFIDRLTAIWQTLNWENWFDGIAIDDPDPEDPDSHKKPPPPNPFPEDALPPFWMQRGNDNFRLFNSDDVRDWTQLGYQYDVLAVQPGESQEARLKRVRSYLDQYAVTSPITLKQQAENPTIVAMDKTKNEYDDYLINVIYDRNALGGDPYTIHFFLGKLTDEEFLSQKGIAASHAQHVGSIYTFSARMNEPENERCANCATQEARGFLSAAQIPLTVPLLLNAADREVEGFESIAAEVVEEYLAHQLDWKVVSLSGNIVSPSRLPKTQIFALRGKATHSAAADTFSTFKDYTPMTSVTAGREFGAAPEGYAMHAPSAAPTA